MKKRLLFAACAFCLQAFGYLALVREIEPFRYFFFVTSWWSFIILADVVLASKRGGQSVLTRRLPLMVAISCGYWCLFEALNLRLQNWHYIGLPESASLRYAGYFLSFGTVLPAIYLTDALLRHLIPLHAANPPFRVPGRYPAFAVSAGILLLAAVIVFPGVAFPFTWVFLALIADGYNHARGYRSFAAEIASGSFAGLVTAMAAGLICGLLWEGWNYSAVSKWIYTVPLVTDSPKLFEMPLPGYLGFLAFGVQTIAFQRLLEGVSRDGVPLSIPAAVALAFSFTLFPLIDRHTLLFFAPAIYR